jgi:hypothetical protein
MDNLHPDPAGSSAPPVFCRRHHKRTGFGDLGATPRQLVGKPVGVPPIRTSTIRLDRSGCRGE